MSESVVFDGFDEWKVDWLAGAEWIARRHGAFVFAMTYALAELKNRLNV